jgi:hypothetical protein
MDFLFLNNALSDFENTIQGVWAPVLQAQGIQILLAVGAIAFAVYAIQLLATHDLPTFILGFAYTIVSLSVLHAVFLYSQDLATDMLSGFQALGHKSAVFRRRRSRPRAYLHKEYTLYRSYGPPPETLPGSKRPPSQSRP